MPSSTPKQRKVMSAIAHGWRPSGLHIPVKVARDFHAADKGKKWGAKRQDGGAVDDDSQEAATARALAAARLASATKPGGGRNEGPASFVLSNYLPHAASGMANLAMAPGRAARAELSQEEAQDWAPAAALGMMTAGRAPPGSLGIMMGRQHARRLPDTPTHPAVGKAIAEESPPAPQPLMSISDIGMQTYRRALGREEAPIPDRVIRDQALRDAQAEGALNIRRAAGNPADADIFRKSGWFYDAKGNPVKEISDVGAKLVRVGQGEYRLEHPAGDLHQILGLGIIKIVNRSPHNRATYDPKTGEIEIFADPRTKTGMAYANGAVLHEIQHRIQHLEGRPFGSSQMMEEMLHPEDVERIGREETNVFPAFEAYRRTMGEVEARNVPNRRGHSFRYLRPPRETEDVPRGSQLMREPPSPPRFAAGGFLSPPWYERVAGRQMRSGPYSGFVNSAVPGRTDRHRVNVGAGAFIVPADTVSAIGQNNSVAGGSILGKMFGMGSRFGSRVKSPKFAEGGEVSNPNQVPVVIAGGEFAIPPEVVQRIGGGDLEQGHRILDRWIMDVRKKHIKTLRKLPGPKK